MFFFLKGDHADVSEKPLKNSRLLGRLEAETIQKSGRPGAKQLAWDEVILGPKNT